MCRIFSFHSQNLSTRSIWYQSRGVVVLTVTHMYLWIIRLCDPDEPKVGSPNLRPVHFVAWKELSERYIGVIYSNFSGYDTSTHIVPECKTIFAPQTNLTSILRHYIFSSLCGFYSDGEIYCKMEFAKAK